MHTARFSGSGRSAQLEADPPGDRTPGSRPPCGQTNTCENITLQQTLFADGRNLIINKELNISELNFF